MYKTPNGKTIELYNEGMMVKAKFKEGGELPDCLKGSWTNTLQAENSINIYIAEKEPLHIQEKDENGIFQKVKNPKKTTVG